MNDDTIEFSGIESVRVIVTGKDGLAKEIIMTAQEICDGAKSARYQTTENYIGFNATRLVRNVTCENLPDHPLLTQVKNGNTSEYQLRGLHYRKWSNSCNIDGHDYLFENEDHFNFILGLAKLVARNITTNKFEAEQKLKKINK